MWDYMYPAGHDGHTGLWKWISHRTSHLGRDFQALKPGHCRFTHYITHLWWSRTCDSYTERSGAALCSPALRHFKRNWRNIGAPTSLHIALHRRRALAALQISTDKHLTSIISSSSKPAALLRTIVGLQELNVLLETPRLTLRGMQGYSLKSWPTSG